MAVDVTCRLVLLLTAVLGICRGFPSGAPSSSCQSMMPEHNATPQDHTRRPSPYAIVLENNDATYLPGEVIEVKILSPDTDDLVRGFLLEVRTLSGVPGSVGTFLNPAKGTKTICSESALTHRTWRSKDKFKGTWQAPAELVGEVVFVATVLLDYDTFWINVRSPIIAPRVVAIPTPSPSLSLLSHSNVTDVCHNNALLPLPVQRPHVAILCQEHAHCPCGWMCCPSCPDKSCDGVALCRQPVTMANGEN